MLAIAKTSAPQSPLAITKQIVERKGRNQPTRRRFLPLFCPFNGTHIINGKKFTLFPKAKVFANRGAPRKSVVLLARIAEFIIKNAGFPIKNPAFTLKARKHANFGTPPRPRPYAAGTLYFSVVQRGRFPSGKVSLPAKLRIRNFRPSSCMQSSLPVSVSRTNRRFCRVSNTVTSE